MQVETATKPKRADARRNYEKLVAAAKDAFTEHDTSASLEDIARRAGVGIGTLYRNFPTREALLEAAYVDEVEAMCSSASDFAHLPPWDALASWLHRFIGYVGRKRSLTEQLFATMDPGAPVFRSCRTALIEAGEPLLRRAQEAGVVRPDTDIAQVIQMVGGIAKIPAEPEEVARILDVALDGLRYRDS